MLQRGGAAPIDGSTAQADEAVTLAFVQQFAEPVDPQTSAETAAAAPSVATSVPTTVAADDEPNGDVAPDSTSGASSLPLVGAVAAALVAVATAAALLRRRARTPLDPAPDLAGIRSDSTSATRITPDEPTDRSSGSLLGLLDASRRMTAALDPATVAAIACAEAVRMIDGEGAMLVRRDDGALRSSHCEPVSLFDTENLERSLLRRVVETGRSVASVASEEPALVDVPVSLTAVAVVADGIVIGALMVVRSASRPFDGADVESLETLAPLVGSALLAARAHGSATELADRDALTGLSNRRRLDRDLAALVSDGRSEVAAFVMVDVDHFKHFNDSNGHAAGDVALQTVARALTDSVRPGDRAYRYGGEEFCVLLPATTQADAELVAERMRRAVESAEIPGGEQQPGGRVTISVGVADSSGGGSSLVERADAALYEAKTAGRNRVCLAPID
jgi:diguanylate cyclase (GGDEF)-like protein